MAKYITQMYDRLDRICYEYYGSTDNGEVEFLLSQNPWLSQYDIILPMGIEIELPDRPPAPKTKPIPTVVLW